MDGLPASVWKFHWILAQCDIRTDCLINQITILRVYFEEIFPRTFIVCPIVQSSNHRNRAILRNVHVC